MLSSRARVHSSISITSSARSQQALATSVAAAASCWYVPAGYDEQALDGFARCARQWQMDGRDAYIFMINGAKLRAPAAALALQERLAV